MPIRVAITGNTACAEAMRQIDPDVVAAYPITPQTTIVEEFASYVANGKASAEYVNVESEHSAMSACIGAAAAGARVMTATSSQGLALMWEMLFIASGLRLPIVMHNVNRALSAPINIHCDHSDSMGARDSGWIQLYSENAQEAYDNTIQAVRIAENKDVLLPVMVCLDGFIISHAIDRVELLDDEVVKEFVGTYKPTYSLLNTKAPITVGPFTLQPYYFEQKRAVHEALLAAKKVILEVAEEFKKISGRSYSLFEGYQLEDADFVLVLLGSTAGTARVVIDELREENIAAGLLKIRVFRPFPAQEIAKALAHAKAVAVLDRADSPGALGGPIFTEVRSALYGRNSFPLIINYIYGLGGRDTGPQELKQVVRELKNIVEKDKVGEIIKFLGLKE
jgi:pyruvate ferredoxin oxidoreductase alpha subunit